MVYNSSNNGTINAQATSPTIVILKSVNKSVAAIGDTLIYTVVITNTGSTSANNMILTDLIPQGANFVDNSVFINTVNAPGINPALGIDAGTLPIGGTTTITFNAVVVTIPLVSNPMVNTAFLDYEYTELSTMPNGVSGSADSNSVNTTVLNPLLVLNKYVSPSIYSPGSTLTYSLRVSNQGSTTANNLTIIDTIPAGTTFVAHSMKIDGTPVSGSPAPPSGITVSSLGAGYYFTLTFNVIVNAGTTANIDNQFIANYAFTVEPTMPNGRIGSNISNVVTNSFSQADLSTSSKSVDKAYATINDILTYSITLNNTGGITANNIIITDTIPSGTTFIANSVTVNGVTQMGSNPSIGVTIPSLAPSAITTVTFKVIVTGG